VNAACNKILVITNILEIEDVGEIRYIIRWKRKNKIQRRSYFCGLPRNRVTNEENYWRDEARM
jgi:hypothetical protein